VAGAYGIVYRPNPCSCGHDVANHTPNCTLCPTPHAFSADPPIVFQSQSTVDNNQRGG
jgi:hypothetical protein